MIPDGKTEIQEGMKRNRKVNMSININDYWLQNNNNILWSLKYMIKMHESNNSHSQRR